MNKGFWAEQRLKSTVLNCVSSPRGKIAFCFWGPSVFAVPRQARHCRVKRGRTILPEKSRCWRMIVEGPGGGSDIDTHRTHHGQSLGLPVQGNSQRNMGLQLLGVSPYPVLSGLPAFVQTPPSFCLSTSSSSSESSSHTAFSMKFP